MPAREVRRSILRSWLPDPVRTGGEPVGRSSYLVGRPHPFTPDRVVRRQMADRIGAGGIAGEQERLAAAPAEVDLAAVTASARLGHPGRPPETLEGRRLGPDLCQRVLTHAHARER